MISRWHADGLEAALARAGLATFDAIWDLDEGYVEEPNVRRGGWSGVSRIALPFDDGARPVFLKRQANHVTRSLRYPVFGEPTLHRELVRLREFSRLHITAPVPLHYAHTKKKGEWRAVLLVAEVPGRSLTSWLDGYGAASRATKDAVMKAVAEVCRRMWSHHYEHRSLYPKHIFLDDSTSRISAAVIDLEKSRHRCLHPTFHVRDLDALNRRTPRVSRADRLRFLLKAVDTECVTPAVREVWTRLVERAARRGVS